jgi:hypothetical protein
MAAASCLPCIAQPSLLTEIMAEFVVQLNKLRR